MKRKTVGRSGHTVCVSSVCQSSPLPLLFLYRKTQQQSRPRALHFLVCFWLAFQLLLLLPLSIDDDNKTTRKKKKRVLPNSLRNPNVAVNKSIVNNPNPNKNLKNKKQKEEEKNSTHFECNRNKQLSSATMTTMMVISEEASSGSTLIIVAKHIGEEGFWGEELGAGEKIDKQS